MKLVSITGGAFRMGTDDNKGFPEDYEGPSTMVNVPSFEIADTPITNKEFKEFIDDTGYVTTAEQKGCSFVFGKLLDEEEKSKSQHVLGTPWWFLVPGADWAHPYGPKSNLNNLWDHPVVHVSLKDALAYCDWSETHLPTEAEWEYAARAGTTSEFPWGDSLTEDNTYHANTWQGKFPEVNSLDDGYLATAPVYNYEPNNWGLYQVIGNVWEWCRNPRYTLFEDFNSNEFIVNKNKLVGEYAIRGGSFLCHSCYCNRYRVAGRNGVDHESTSSHLSFRCIKE